MSIRIRFAALCAVLAALAAIPSVADARSVELRGVVSGSPYGANNSQLAVPVLFSKETARKAGLKSPVGVIIVKRTEPVRLPGNAGFTQPVNMRTGDRFKGFGVVGTPQRKAFYPRVTYRKPVIYFRSKELSLAELSAAIDALRLSLADLQKQMQDLRSSTLAGLQSLQTQINDIKKTLESLQSLTQQINNLTTTVNGITTTLTNLTNQLTSLLTQVTGLQQTVDTLVSNVSALTTQLTTVRNNLATVCNALKGATVDPDGSGPMPPVAITFPPGTITTVCP